ncbi:hypothetical protein [Streptomyces sp. NPDC048516]|uniref:hypothetical protein n=1 Tax=Streptomyces sp. NPDC048516 TaxID=3365565 RepID=UPI003714EA76
MTQYNAWRPAAARRRAAGAGHADDAGSDRSGRGAGAFKKEPMELGLRMPGLLNMSPESTFHLESYAACGE